MGEPTRLADEIPTQYRELLAEIRANEGFETFFLGPSEEELRSIAQYGPIVAFNISPIRSDALLITHEGCRSLELPGLSMSECSKQRIRCHDALKMHFSAFEAEGVREYMRY